MYQDRIPYDSRANSQLSVAKYSGGIKINGEYYVLDYAGSTPQMIDGEPRFFPDLVKESTIVKTKKSKMKSVSLF